MTVLGISNTKRFVGVHADVKPTADVPVGSEFWESDHDEMYRWNGSAWCLTTMSMTAKSAGLTQVFSKSITSAANAGDVTVATITTQGCAIKSAVIRSEGANADMTSCGLFAGASKVVELVAASKAIVASLNAADKQVSEVGSWVLAATKTIVMTLAGTGATPVALTVIVEYEAVADGGYLV